LYLAALALLLPAAGGCRQKMAEMPYYKPYEPTEFYADKYGNPGMSARPLERGVVHRGQRLDTDPLVTGLTDQEWGAYYSYAAGNRGVAAPKVDPGATAADQLQEQNKAVAFGSPRYDPRVEGAPKVYVTDFPFPISEADMNRGMERYTIYCAVCHGALGNGQGKIWERGYLTPTSFHTHKVTPDEVDAKNPPGIPLGYSRGYALWGIKIPMREVPVGYYFEVITKGYAGMPSYSAQIPPADRWKIIAYVRALQVSQNADPGQNAGGKK
jgi:mono/diheme cytochrome c family protein